MQSLNPQRVPTTRLHRHLGATPTSESSTRFCVWAPLHDRVAVEFPDSGRREPMERIGEYYVAEIDNVRSGDLYMYRFSDHTPRPDPASRFQPQGVHGPSEVVATDFPWTDQGWRGVAAEDLVIYELHLGAFTAEGTYLAAIDRLDELVELGVSAVELMPLASSAGRWNWGYDGVCLFAPSCNYGRPEQLRRLVDAAHGRGLAVLLDVVYNHLGPEGNYLHDAGPYLSAIHSTVWGDAPNFDDPQHGRELRRFMTANAIHWLDEYHFDGLRVDAIHCMRDESEVHVAAEMSDAVHAWRSRGASRRHDDRRIQCLRPANDHAH